MALGLGLDGPRRGSVDVEEVVDRAPLKGKLPNRDTGGRGDVGLRAVLDLPAARCQLAIDLLSGKFLGLGHSRSVMGSDNSGQKTGGRSEYFLEPLWTNVDEGSFRYESQFRDSTNGLHQRNLGVER